MTQNVGSGDRQTWISISPLSHAQIKIPPLSASVNGNKAVIVVRIIRDDVFQI